MKLGVFATIRTVACATAVLCLLALRAAQTTEPVSGQLTGDVVWTDPSVRYVLEGETTVDLWATLTIGPGVEVYNSGCCWLNVDGVLNATGAAFTGNTYLRVRDGGRMNLSGSSVASPAGAGVVFEDGSRGGLTGNTFSTSPLQVWSRDVRADDNTFQDPDPIYTYPSWVTELSDNRFEAEGGATIRVRGVMGNDTTWPVMGQARRYVLDGEVTVPLGQNLRIDPGVEVFNSGCCWFYVDGVLDATGVSFTGRTFLRVRDGGQMTLSGSSLACADGVGVIFDEGSRGNLTGNTFSTAPLQVWSRDVRADDNAFQDPDPIFTYPSWVTELSDNRFEAEGGATIHVRGVMGDDTAWPVMGQARRYALDGEVTVPLGQTLTITPGVAVYNSGCCWFYVDGVLNATGTAFTGRTHLRIRDGGQMNLRGSSVACAEGVGVVFDDGSRGSLTGNTFSTSPLQVWSREVRADDNTFQDPDPIFTYPSWVTELGDNRFEAEGGATIHVRGEMGNDTIWPVMGQARRYTLDGEVTVPLGQTLTVNSGVEVYNSGCCWFYVDGVLDAAGAAFTGRTHLRVRDGGQLNLSGSSVACAEGAGVVFDDGSRGSLTGNTFSTSPLTVRSGEVRADDNTFQDPDPVFTYPSWVTELGDNRFEAEGGATIHVSGAVGNDTTWPVMGQARRYTLDGEVTVPLGQSLKIEPGVEVFNSGCCWFYVDGMLNATGAAFTGHTYLRVRDGGQMTLAGSAVGGDALNFDPGSSAEIRYTTLALSVTLDAGATLAIRDSDFSRSTVTAAGSPAATINLRGNYWGTTDTRVIEGRVQHHPDNAQLPLVDYGGWLLAPPSERLFYALDYAPRRPTNVATDHLEVAFNREADLATFRPEAVSLASGRHQVPVVNISQVEAATYRLQLEATLPADTYTLTLDPAIRDVLGNPLNQDFDGEAGERPDDAFSAEIVFDFTAPKVLRHLPTGDLGGTMTAFEVVFSETMDPASFGPVDVQVRNPAGTPVNATEVTPLAERRFRVSLPPQTAFGQYHVTIGLTITDPAGNPLDQDGDGNPGEPADVYKFMFNLVDVDLQVRNVTVTPTPLWAGEAVRVSYTGTNSTGVELLGSWTDAIYFSGDATWDLGDVLLAQVSHTNGLPVGGAYTNTITVVVPGVLPGNYRALVRADLFNQEREARNGEGNNVAVSDSLSLAVHGLATGEPGRGTLSTADRADYYVIHLDPGENLRLRLDAVATLGANEVYAAWGRLPSRQNFDARAHPSLPDADLVVPGTYDGGDLYVLAYAATGTEAGTSYTLGGTAYQVILDRLSPAYCGRTVPAVITLMGDGFNQTTQVELTGPDSRPRAPTAKTVISPAQMTVTLDLPNWPTGLYDLRVTTVGGGLSELGQAFRVYDGLGPKLEVNLVVPNWVGSHGGSRLWIEYANTGDAPMPAPALVVHASRRAGISLNAAYAGQWWEGVQVLPDDAGDTVIAWATGSGGTPGTLQPGDSGRIPVFYMGLPAFADWQGDAIEFSLGALEASEAATLDWASLRDRVRPEWMSAEAWNAAWAAFTAHLGDAWGDLVRLRADLINHLHGLGQDTTRLSMDQVLSCAVAQAAEAGPVSTLASTVEAYARAPGVPLTFARVFGQSLPSRHRLGVLGQGWSHNWEYTWQKLGNGNVVIHGPAGMTRYFQKRSSGGGFEGLGGDPGQLVASGSGYRLTEKSGLVTQFRSDGRLDFVEDTNGNRISGVYAGERLTAVVHSNGAQLQLAYDAHGRISSVTNPHGTGPADDQVTTYGYDASGNYLVSATAPGGHVTGYAYQTTGPAPVLHALLSVTFPDQRHASFAYDAVGRLIETKGDQEANRITYTYPSLGVVTARDAAGVATTVRYGATGQANRIELGTSLVQSEFDAQGQMTQLGGPEGQVARFTYDATGNLTGLTDPNRGVTQFEYSSTLNRLTRVVDARGHKVQHAYDAKGNLTRITYEDGTHEDFAYAAKGNIARWTNRRGQSVSFTYNGGGQVLTKDYSTTPEVDFTYTYDSRGNLTQTTDATGTNRFRYDADTTWLRRVEYPGGQWFEFEYDAAGRRTKRTDQDGRAETYAYDAQGRLERLTDEGGNLIVRYEFDTAGRMSRKTLGNGVFTTYAYDSSGQLTELVNSQPDGTVLSRFAYTYDASGRRTAMTTLEGPTQYGYDALGQLTRVQYPDGKLVEYHYDAVGNRTKVIENGRETPYTVNALNQYTLVGQPVGGTRYEYDADGNLTHKWVGSVVTTYRYDPENRLVAMSNGPVGLHAAADTSLYSYDALNNLAQAQTAQGDQRYVTDLNGHLALEYNSLTAPAVRYANGYGLEARTTGDGQSQFYMFDGEGNTSCLVDRAGTPLNTYVLDAWGQERARAETVPNALTYRAQGGYRELAPELYRPGGRVLQQGTISDSRPYAAANGRPLSPDLSNYTFSRSRYELSRPSYGSVVEQARTDGPATRTRYWPAVTVQLAFLKGGYDFDAGEFYGGLTVDVGAGAYITGHRFVAAAGPFGIEIGDDRPKSNYGLAVVPILGGDLSLWEVTRGEKPEIMQGEWAFGLYGGIQLEAILTEEELAQLFSELSWLAWQSLLALSHDPNDKLTTGYGEAGFITGDGLLPYTIRFENQAQATAPAQMILVTDTLDEHLDLSTFELTEIALGQRVIVVPPGLDAYQATLDLQPEGIAAVVDVEVALNRETRELTATFTALDPLTGWLPEDVMTGLLYPNDATGRGEGHIAYLVQPQSGLVSGTTITNQATIFFDYNEPIQTQRVVNTIDTTAPGSSVSPMPNPLTTTFFVQWSGQDEAGGCGVASYDLFVAVDRGPYTRWLTRATNTFAAFTGEAGRTYSFYSVARDQVGNEEAPPAGADVQVTVAGGTPPLRLTPLELSEGRFGFRFETEAGRRFTIEASGDVAHWEVLGEVLGTGAPAEFLDAESPRQAHRFYRVRQE